MFYFSYCHQLLVLAKQNLKRPKQLINPLQKYNNTVVFMCIKFLHLYLF